MPSGETHGTGYSWKYRAVVEAFDPMSWTTTTGRFE